MVSSAIMLSAVSIIGVMMLAWANGSMLEQKMEIEEVYSTQMNRINEDLLFENIWFALPAGDMSDNHLNVTLTNIGILGLNVTSIQITNVTNGNTTSIPPYPFTDLGIIKSESKSRNVTYAWQSSDELEILVLTKRGNQYITQVVAP